MIITTKFVRNNVYTLYSMMRVFGEKILIIYCQTQRFNVNLIRIMTKDNKIEGRINE
jgi:hypothetical protein